jgi:hypothetical protein
MTAVERQQRRRARLATGRPYADLEAACSKKEWTRFLQSLRAVSQLAKKERQAEQERALAEKIGGGRPIAPRGQSRAGSAACRSSAAAS